MSRRNGVNNRKLMDWQAPEASLGAILGILATTYELDPTFVETDLLPAILGLGAWDDRSWSSRVALERSLAGLEATSILVDQRRYRGRPRSLHVEVFPAIGIGGQKLHAKIVLIVHEHAIRFQVASANLTEYGYRENREVALPLIATTNAPEVAALVLQAVESMPKVLAPWWTPSAAIVSDLARKKLEEWSQGAHAELGFVWGGTSTPLWKLVLDGWPVGERVERISIVSPFWSEEGAQGPFTTLVSELRKRGALAEYADVHLYTEAEATAQGTYQPVLPPLGPLDPKKLQVRVMVHAVQSLPSDEPNTADILKRRKLHAKLLLLHGSKTTLAYVGSANFTMRGWGFTGSPEDANVEAGVILARNGGGLAAALLPPTTGKVIELDATTTADVFVKKEPEGKIPTFLRGVWLEADPADPDRLRLLIQVDPLRVKGHFAVASSGGHPVVLMRGDQGVTEGTYVPLDAEGVTHLLREQQVRVTWWESDDPSDYPVNIELSARANLPAVPGSPNPNERLLLAYYQGRISVPDLFPPPPGWEEDLEKADPTKPGASEVDTTRIQAYQVREFVEALQGIRDDLAAASKGTNAVMRLAVHGAVSPVALAKRVRDAVKSGKRGATAAGFEFVEIAACLKEASEVPGATAAWSKLLNEGRHEVVVMLSELAAGRPDELGPKTSFARYAHEVVGWNTRAVQCKTT